LTANIQDTGTQGVDPKLQVFEALAALAYATESTISRFYIDQSRMLSATVNACMPEGLRGARVLDMGCGWGTTTMAFSRLGPPKEIWAVDSSAAMIDLYRLVLIDDRPIQPVLLELGASAILGRLYPQLIKHLERMRREFRDGLFWRNAGEVRSMRSSCLDFALPENGKLFDVLVANNMVHWPIKEIMAKLESAGASREEAFDQAFARVFGGFAKLVRPGGIVAFLEPKDFLFEDRNPGRDTDLMQNEAAYHPIMTAMQETVNRLLLERHGIKRQTYSTTRLFRLSELPRRLRSVGLELERESGYEYCVEGDPIDSIITRMPMWTGAINLPLETKMALAFDAGEIVREQLLHVELNRPMRAQEFIFVARVV